MKAHTLKVNENIEDLIQSLTTRLNSLQSQYINFVSFCSNTINTHSINTKKELNNLTIKSIQSGVSKCIESLQISYQKATNDLGFSVMVKNVQDALDGTQKQILQLNRQNISQVEYERIVSTLFMQLSEIVTRKILKTRVKAQKGELRTKKFSVQYLQKETQDYKEKVEKLEKKVAQLTLELESQGERSLSKGKLLYGEFNKFNSGINSPVASPILGDNRLRTGYLNSKNSPERGIDLERFKLKLDNLAGLLEKFNYFTVKLDETISTNPNLSEIVLNFKSAKSELAFALMEIGNSRNSPKKVVEERSSDTSASNEIYMMKSEYCKLKAELHHKSSEIMDLNDQVKRMENELKENRRNFIVRKEENLRVEKEKEEIQLESIYLKSQIEKLQKTNKLLQDTLQSQEKKTNDFVFLQTKYDEIIQDFKLKPKSFLHQEQTSSLSIFRNSPKKNSLKIDQQSHLSLDLKKANAKFQRKSPNMFEENQNIEVIYQLNKKITLIIGEKTKIEEGYIQIKEKLLAANEENKLLNGKLCEALEMCKIFEDFLNKSQVKKTDFVVVFVGSHFFQPAKKNKPPAMPSKIPKIDGKVEQMKKSEERVAELEKFLKSKNDEIGSISKEKEKILEELSQSKLMNSSFKSTISSLEFKIKSISYPVSPSKATSNLTLDQVSSKFSTLSSFFTCSFNTLQSSLAQKFSKLTPIKTSLNSLKKSLALKTQYIQELKSDLKSLQLEKTKLLETRDKLIIQCNTQSEELISLKLEQEESFIHKKEDEEYKIQLLKNQIKNLQSSESNLIQALTETTEKFSKLVQSSNDKDSKIEHLTAEISQLRFKQSTNTLDPSNKYKEEVYSLKMKNIKLEQALEEIKNSEISPEEVNKLKDFHLAQITKIDEDRKISDKKFKDSESAWNREKEALQKSLDSFTKQLAGANMEIHNLKNKIKDLMDSINPQFYSNDEYKIVKVVEYESITWYLLEVLNSQSFIWTKELQFENTDEIKDPLPNLIKERSSLQKLNSELCAQNNKMRMILSKVEGIAKRENFFTVLNAIVDAKNEKSEMNEPKKEEVKRNRAIRGFRFGDVKTVNEANDRESIESRRSNQSNKSTVFKMILQDKDEELMKKNDWIRKQEIGIINLKEENNRLKDGLERFQHLKLLLAKLQMMNPKMSSDCLKVFKTIVAFSEQGFR